MMDPACLDTIHPCTQFLCLSRWKNSIIIPTYHFLYFFFLLVSYILLLKALANKISYFNNRLKFHVSSTGLAYKMVSPSLSLGLAVVLIYCTLLVQPRLFPPFPSRPPAPSMLPPPRLQRQETPLPRPNKSPPVSSPPPLKKKTAGKHPQKLRTPPPSKEKLNLGKKIGLLFTGIAAILQVFVVAFLVVKSRKMFKNKNSH